MTPRFLISRPNCFSDVPPLWLESITRNGHAGNWTDNMAWACECDAVDVSIITADYKARNIAVTVVPADQRSVLLEANRAARYEAARREAVRDGNVDAIDKLDRQHQAALQSGARRHRGGTHA